MRELHNEQLAMDIILVLESEEKPKMLMPALDFEQRAKFINKFREWRAKKYGILRAQLNNEGTFDSIFLQAKYSGYYTQTQLELIQQKVSY